MKHYLLVFLPGHCLRTYTWLLTTWNFFFFPIDEIALDQTEYFCLLASSIFSFLADECRRLILRWFGLNLPLFQFRDFLSAWFRFIVD